MPAGNILDPSSGHAPASPQILGFGPDTGVQAKAFGAPGAQIYYVDPNNPSAFDLNNFGQSPDAPLLTIQAAVNLCRAYRGDTIVVAPNDAWQFAAQVRNTPITEAVIIPASKGGIHIVGMATNPMACTWSPPANNGVALTVHATDVLVEGFLFYPGSFTGCTAIVAEWDSTPGVDRFGENLHVHHCFFPNELAIGISMDFSWYCAIHTNYFEGLGTAAILNTSVVGDADFCHIEENHFKDCVLAISMPGADGCHVYHNWLNGDPTGTNNFIDLTGGQDNLVSTNYLSCSIVQYDTTCSDAGSGSWLDNVCNNGWPAAPPT